MRFLRLISICLFFRSVNLLAVTNHDIAGACASAVATFVTCPLANLEMCLQAGISPRLSGLWDGHLRAQMIAIPYGAIRYHVIKDMEGQFGASPEKTAAYAGCGALVAGVFLYPLDLLRTIKATGVEKRSLLEAAQAVVKKNGIGGLYAGCGYTVAYSTLASGIMFGSHAWLRRKTDSPLAAGCFAGVCAKILCLPLDGLRIRRQIGADLNVVKGRYLKNFPELYRGFVPGTMRAVVGAATAFLVLDAFEETED